MIDTFDLNEIVLPLHRWFEENARILPWRDEPTPYRVWISEIMLQQTRVEAVKPFYERFMSELPDIKALAECEDDRLLKLWEGLGYYNRVRNLKVAANQILEQYQGKMPGEFDELLKLKGIGHYTAGAISSIAFGNPVPAVDGNVLRVISRITADNSDIMKQSVRNHMEEVLSKLMIENKAVVPKIFNQSLMELGAIVCVPNGMPYCEKCPLGEICEARKQQQISQLPVKTKPKKRKIEERTVLVVRDGNKYAICKRPDKGLLAGMYELPNFERYLTEDEIAKIVTEHGYTPLRIHPIEEAKHIFSHVEWRMQGFMVSLGDIEMEGYQETLNQVAQHLTTEHQTQEEYTSDNQQNWIFIEADEAEHKYAIPTAFARYVEYIKKQKLR